MTSPKIDKQLYQKEKDPVVVNEAIRKVQTILQLPRFSQVNVQVITATGTYTPTAGLRYVLAFCTGAGGGGGGADCSDVTATSMGEGGGSGATVIKLWNATELGASASVTIGAGGAGGANTGVTGSTGGTTSVDPAGTGTTLSATGGTGGDGLSGSGRWNINFPVSAGGTGTGGDLNLTGSPGESGQSTDFNAAFGIVFSGNGAPSFWGGGGARPATLTEDDDTSTAGVDGTAYGSGGSGAVAADTTTGAAGGAGAAGVAIFIEFIAT
jgi:hypothetical protein